MPAERFNTQPEVEKQIASDLDLVNFYLDKTSEFPLLTAQEEVELAKAIELGLIAQHKLEEDRFLLERGNQPLLNNEERELLLIIQEEGGQANETMINSNLRLVVSMAKKFQNRGLTLLDLIQSGNEGLIHAVEKFDYKKGYKFSTYAQNWIRQRILKGLADDSRVIRVPIEPSKQIRHLRHIEGELIKELGRRPTIKELAAEMDKDVETIKELKEWDLVPVSFNMELSGEKYNNQKIELGDIIVDDEMPNPEDYTVMTLLRGSLIKAIKDHTNERDRQIVLTYFGLGGDGLQNITHQMIAETFHMSANNVRRIIKDTLQQIREHEMHLRSFLED